MYYEKYISEISKKLENENHSHGSFCSHGCVQKCRSLDGCAPFSLPCVHIRIFSPDLFAEPLLSMYHDVHDADATLLMTLNGALDVTKVAHARRSTPGYSCISLKCGFRMWKRLQEFSYDRSTMWRNPISLDRFFLHLRETNNVSWFSGWTIFRWKNWKRKRYSQNPFNSRDINN